MCVVICEKHMRQWACYRCLRNKHIMHDITLRNFSDFVSSYHWKIFLTQAFWITRIRGYYVAISTSYHRIIITSDTFKSIVIDITLSNLSDFVSLYHRITEKYILPWWQLILSKVLCMMLHYIIFLTSYHRIIVSPKNISHPGLLNNAY